jgi:hypothetical protein
VAGHHQCQGEGEADRVQQVRGQAGGVEDRFQGVCDGGLAESAEGQRGEGDAELGAGELGGHRLHRGQDGAGAPRPVPHQWFDLGAAGGDQRELGGDEEPVGREQEDDPDRVEEAHRRGRTSVTPAPARCGAR